jgi:hypothetical protein
MVKWKIIHLSAPSISPCYYLIKGYLPLADPFLVPLEGVITPYRPPFWYPLKGYLPLADPLIGAS